MFMAPVHDYSTPSHFSVALQAPAVVASLEEALFTASVLLTHFTWWHTVLTWRSGQARVRSLGVRLYIPASVPMAYVCEYVASLLSEQYSLALGSAPLLCASWTHLSWRWLLRHHPSFILLADSESSHQEVSVSRRRIVRAPCTNFKIFQTHQVLCTHAWMDPLRGVRAGGTSSLWRSIFSVPPTFTLRRV